MLLLVEVLKAHAGSQRAKDRQGSNDHGRAEGFGQATANQFEHAWKGSEAISRVAIGDMLAFCVVVYGVFCGGDGALEEFWHIAFAWSIDGRHRGGMALAEG